MMKSLSEYMNEPLSIVKPSFFKENIELKSREVILARMHFPKLFSSTAIIEGFDGKWEFRQTSIWKNKYEIFQHGYSLSFAQYQSKTLKKSGILSLPRGIKLIFQFKIFKELNSILEENGETLLTIANKGFFNKKIIVSLAKKSTLLDEYPWLILFLWYVATRDNAHVSVYC